MTKYALIVAGGSGARMGTTLPKQFLLLNGKPVLWHTITAFQQAYRDIRVILVLPEQHLETGSAIGAASLNPSAILPVAGGDSRFASVRNGLAHVPGASMVFIHDGVRCLVTQALIERCYRAALDFGNAIPAVAAVDSVRLITQSGNQVIDRNQVRMVQTPQTFYSTVVKEAYRQPYNDSFTDEASVVEQWGEKIHLVDGEATNIKITRPSDLAIAATILQEREKHP